MSAFLEITYRSIRSALRLYFEPLRWIGGQFRSLQRRHAPKKDPEYITEASADKVAANTDVVDALLKDESSKNPTSLRKGFSRITDELHKMPLSILVWGPGQGDLYYHKRIQIKERLMVTFENSEVFFSEDFAQAGLLFQERMMLAAFDIFIVLDDPRGPRDEIALLVASGHAHKLFILTHEEYKQSTAFPDALHKYGNQEFYSDIEFVTCTVVERAIRRVTEVARQKMIAEGGSQQ